MFIGNSFSEDATYFLHQILEDAGIKNQVVNLFIGGCPLEKHWANIEGNRRDYEFQLNGRKTDRFASIPEVLVEAKWDAVVTQQASHDSGWLDSYEPFLGWTISGKRPAIRRSICMRPGRTPRTAPTIILCAITETSRRCTKD